jgi:hypothetical protein
MVHSWLKQACTEMVMPMSYSEDRSMYPPYKFDYASYADNCIKSYGVRPRPRWITTNFGGHVSLLCSVIAPFITEQMGRFDYPGLGVVKGPLI